MKLWIFLLILAGGLAVGSHLLVQPPETNCQRLSRRCNDYYGAGEDTPLGQLCYNITKKIAWMDHAVTQYQCHSFEITIDLLVKKESN